ncbi:superantigen-like protein [Staphylococcus hyicus]|uniref:Superantigen-like protein n=1 Tax=Staphylococcus hyicus TaxID=1284 RepID=A0A418JJQ4_STAHY|nr:superantigen-like protein [Staphylococcus hyicus]NJH80693.1 superantigen-like protein [Staphylococcus hyicus]RIO46205.1 superantigen-like protein [Staphylococcus hyicus]
MKLSTIAKTSLALGILTTGVMTTYAQSANAEVQTSVQNNNQSQDVNDLLTYYNKPSFDHRNVRGYKTGDKVDFVDEKYNQHSEVGLVGNNKDKYKSDDDLSNIDVFVVREGNGKQSSDYTIGGITQPNKLTYKDYVKRVPFSVESTSNGWKVEQGLGAHEISKEEISLKELDFKLRKKLIDKKLLYTDGKKNGKIVVKMNSGKENDKYTFELDKKLQDHRMGDVIDSRNIEKITVEL